MKKLSRLLCLCLAVLLLAGSFVGCHEKDEIAFTIGESKFTSAMFSCVQFFSANIARNAIDTYLADNELDTKNVKYENYKFDADGKVVANGTPYEKYVRDEAIRVLRQNAALDALLKEKNLEVDENTKNAAGWEAYTLWYYGCDYNTYYQYSSYGMLDSLASYYTPYALLLEQNGVAYSTYLEYKMYDAKYDYYFNHLYGEKGEKEVPKDDIVKFMTEHYVVGDSITVSKKDSKDKDLSKEKLEELKKLFDGYAERLNKGEKFADIYKEETARVEAENKANTSSSSGSTTSSNNSSAASSNASSNASSVTSSTTSSATASTTTSSGTTSSETKKYSPESYTGVFGDKETGYSDDLFDQYKKQEIGKAVVIDDTANSQYLLFVRRDMTDESYENYWFDGLKSTILYSLKQDEFNDSLNEKGNALKLAEDTHATSPFDVDEIKFDIEG